MAKKRGNSEGSIYRMQDGRWRAAVMIGWKVAPDGKRTQERRVFTGATRHEVANQLTDALKDLKLGLLVAPRKQTLGQFLTWWLDEVVKSATRPKTMEFLQVYGHLLEETKRETADKMNFALSPVATTVATKTDNNRAN